MVKRSQRELLSHQSFPGFRAVEKRPKGRLERLLSVFADVRAGEGVIALMMAANIFLLLGAYYVLKPVREALILSESGAEVKSYSAAAQAVVLLVAVPIYGWFASKVTRSRLLSSLTVFFVSNLALFWIAGSRGWREGVVFYIWLGIFSVFMVSQFWAFANDIYTESQGKRLFPPDRRRHEPRRRRRIGGSRAAGETGPRRTVLTDADRSRRPARIYGADAGRHGQDSPETGRGKRAGGRGAARNPGRIRIDPPRPLSVLDRSPHRAAERRQHCRRICPGQTRGSRAPRSGADAKAFISEFYGRFYSLVNLSGLTLQALATSRVFRHFGVRGALFILPVLALLSYSAMAVVPVLAVVRWMKVIENSTDYSIMNTVRQALWLPTSREAKYKAEAAIDTFFMRGGDVLQAGIVFLGTTAGAGIRGFGWLNVALTAAWLLAARQIAVEHRKRGE